MDLQIRNFGAIENADVKFDGLTVIAGENDTGKSTVGKLVFAVIKAISRYEQDLEVGKGRNIYDSTKDFYTKIRRNGKLMPTDMNEFHPTKFARELNQFITNQLLSPQEEDRLDALFEKKDAAIQRMLTVKNAPYNKNELLEFLNDIKVAVRRKEDKSEVRRKALGKALNAEFYGDFSPKYQQLRTTITFNEGENKLFEIRANRNRVSNFKIHDDIIPFEDVTLIDSPNILQLFRPLSQSQTVFEMTSNNGGVSSQPIIMLHIKDLINKMTNSVVLPFDFNDIQTEVRSKIKQLIQGDWRFNEGKQDFIFSKEGKNGKKMQVRSVNTASGIKSFGIIQLLLLAEILNNRSLLIIDEPETHLHPKWQVEYAKVLCLLVKHEIPVLLTSHSPYLIEALRYYSKEYNIERFTNYYLAERNDNGLVDIENVNENMNRVFHKLSEPFQKLLWEEA